MTKPTKRKLGFISNLGKWAEKKRRKHTPEVDSNNNTSKENVSKL
jgi:hypothetical protein